MSKPLGYTVELFSMVNGSTLISGIDTQMENSDTAICNCARTRYLLQRT